MNGLRPPLTAPPGFAVRQSRSDSKECCRPALLFREGEFPWQTRKPIKNISSAGTTPLARLLSAVPDSVRPCRNYVELHIILLYFPAFCDTILILINFTAENSRWNINIFAKVFPAKSPQIHPTISEFAEWEWFALFPGNPDYPERANQTILQQPCRHMNKDYGLRKISGVLFDCAVHAFASESYWISAGTAGWSNSAH